MVKINTVVPRQGSIILLELNPRTGSEQSGYRLVEEVSTETMMEVLARLEPLVNFQT